MSRSALGQIFTFYSYKGGTGRSMALANVACLLSQRISNSEKVLMIDWDLEAPGLHRFFDKTLKKTTRSSELDKQPGLIDLFIKMAELCGKLSQQRTPDSFFEKLEVDKYITKSTIHNLFLMTAGRFDDAYPTKVNTFDWEDLFNKNPWLISDFANYLTTKFRYILIDSRTGFTDISSVCTAIMPEKLVVVFTPNRQSLTGVLQLIENSTSYRRNSDDLRPLVVFPLASRIENAESNLQKDWRFGNKEKRISGYQLDFEAILRQVYKLPSINLSDYFDDIQIQYVPRYSYGEEIAVLSDRSEDRLSIARSYESFADMLVSVDAPWDYKGKSATKFSEETTTSNIYISGSYARGTSIDQSGDVDITLNRISDSKLMVFLSHASPDKSVVRELYQRLALESWIDPWLDEEKLLPGQDWSMEITKAVKAAHAVIVCLSNQSVTREGYIQKELQLTLEASLESPEGQIFILPVRLEDCEVPRSIRTWQYVDYFPKERLDKAYDRLRQSLRIRAGSLGLAPAERSKPATVFISYAHKDEKFRDELVQILKPLQNHGSIKLWQDREITPGDEWFQSTRAAINTCDLALLLISSDFLASRFIQDDDLQHLLKRRTEEGLRIVPIIIRPCMWHSDPLLSNLQALPRDGKPIVSFSNETGDRDRTWTDVAKAIEVLSK